MNKFSVEYVRQAAQAGQKVMEAAQNGQLVEQAAQARQKVVEAAQKGQLVEQAAQARQKVVEAAQKGQLVEQAAQARQKVMEAAKNGQLVEQAAQAKQKVAQAGQQALYAAQGGHYGEQVAQAGQLAVQAAQAVLRPGADGPAAGQHHAKQHCSRTFDAVSESCLPDVAPDDPMSDDVPFVGLLNPRSGSKMGAVFLREAQKRTAYTSRLFDIVHVASNHDSKGDEFRAQLDRVRDEAKAKKATHLGKDFRPRLICGGGDGTASFALTCVFKALMLEGDEFTGYRWSTDDLNEFFPALVQLPLGTGNDLAGILGWGRTIDPANNPKGAQGWFKKALNVKSPVRAFDVWGLFPSNNGNSFKACMLNGLDKHGSPLFKVAGPSVPFLTLLYFSMGRDAFVVAQVEHHRTESQIMNKAQYLMQGTQAVLGPGASNVDLDGVEVLGGDETSQLRLYPPARLKAAEFQTVGFMNINSVIAGAVEAKDGANFSDEKMDFYCESLFSAGTNMTISAGTHTTKTLKVAIPTEKHSRSLWRVDGEKQPCTFVQYDGEGRVLFHPNGEAVELHVRQVMQIPVVVDIENEGPPASQPLPATLRFTGSEVEKAETQQRIYQLAHGALIAEMNATSEETLALEHCARERRKGQDDFNLPLMRRMGSGKIAQICECTIC